MSCRAHCHECCLTEQRFCSKVGINAETKLAIVRHSLNWFLALEVLVGLVDGVVGVGWGDGGMGSRVANLERILSGEFFVSQWFIYARLGHMLIIS